MIRKQQEQKAAINLLRKILKPGDTVYSIVRHVSRSGMSRSIDFYVIKKNEPRWITSLLGHAIGQPQRLDEWRRSRGLRVNGCGMDMCFHCVYSLGRVLFPNGFVPAKAGMSGRNGDDPNAVDTDGGYALRSHTL